MHRNGNRPASPAADPIAGDLQSRRLPDRHSPPRRNLRRRTTDTVDEGCGEADLLSRLPDDVLSRILSFLCLEEAIRAKLLSRRWSYLCPTKISFDYLKWEDQEGNSGFRKKYMARVDEVMRQFSAAQVERLELCLPDNMGSEYAPKVDEWIRIANGMKVQHLHFRFYEYSEPGEKVDDESFLYDRFPLNLLQVGESSHLKFLEISSCYLPPFTSLGGPIISLQTLVLDDITFGQTSGSFDDIASYCPNLERLDILNCKQIPSMRYLCAQLHCLKSLTLGPCNGLVDFEIHDVSITDFRYYGRERVDNISFKGLKNLRFADIRTRCSGKKVAIFLSSLPEEAPQLKCLRLFMPGSKDFQSPSFVSPFGFLKHLDMQIFTTIDSDQVQSLFGFVGAAPLLQNLILDLRGKCIAWSDEQLHRAYKEAPIHVHSSLKKVEIKRHEYRLGKGDVELAVTLLKSAVSLEKMSLGSLDQDSCVELLRALAKYKPRVKFSTAWTFEWIIHGIKHRVIEL